MPPRKKVCTRCKVTKPVAEYSKSQLGAGGLRSSCKDCERKRHREDYKNGRNLISKEYYKKNRARLMKRQAEYQKSEHGREVLRLWRKKNSAKEYARVKAWRLKRKLQQSGQAA